MDRLLIDYKCEVNLEATRGLRKLFEQVLLSTISDKTLNNQILLCLSETITNIVIHGQPRASKIVSRLQQLSQSWVMTISDDAGFFDLTSVNHGELFGNDNNLENGRGLSLIKASCRHIEYDTDIQSENRLVFSWPINQQTDRSRILLVEDELSVRSLYESYLDDSYEVYSAKNGKEALEKLKHHAVDLVLSDINMPELDGLSLRSELIQKPEYELTPFVFLTASEKDELRARATSLGIDDYIIKPVTRDDLITHIERVLHRSNQIVKKITTRFNRKISQSFTPRIPDKLNHWNIAVSRRDSGIGGGDLLLLQPDENSSLVALIDTMGHDECAKFFSYAYGGFISGMMRTVPNTGLDCRELLQNISKMAYNDDLLSKSTLTGIIFNLASEGKITMVSAAHPQPLLISGDSIKTIEVEGILPGLLPEVEYEPVQINLQAGERIAFYTDGLFESAADEASRKYLEQQILATIKRTIDDPIDRASRLVMKRFDEIAGKPPMDDTTFLLLEPILE